MSNCRAKACGKEIPEGALYCPWCGKKQIAEPKKHRRRANGTGTVYRKPGNRTCPWYVEMNGQFISSHKSYTEACRALEQLQSKNITDKFNYTFAQIYERWKPEHDREISKSQQENYATAYNHCSDLYDRKFRDLRKSDFRQVIMQMEAEGYSLSSCEKVLQLFGQLSQWAYDEDIVQKNHSANIKIVATQKKQRIPFTKEELKAIAASTEPAAAILRILIATGCRGKDLFTAKLSDCHSDYFISGSKTEAGYDRPIAVSDYGLADYQTLVLMATVSPDAKLLIDGYSGNRVYNNWSKRDFADLRKVIDIGDKTAYNARHTYATAAFKSRIPQDILTRQMGHEDIHTTDKIYHHSEDDRIVAECRKVKIL